MDKDEERIYQSLKEQWQPVSYSKPLGFDTLFHKLNHTLWPALPESYEWRIEKDGTIDLYKHKLAPDRNVNFVTYFTDSLEKFNFLSRWDGATQHSFAYTRKDLKNDNLRDTYPVDFPNYMCGHCIDFLDTHGISELSTCPGGRGSVIVDSISTLDPRNYIPEPILPTPYWGETARRDLVKEIRQKGGTYAQYMYYFFAPPTTNGVAVPWGIYFVETTTPSVNSYNVPWPHPGRLVDDVHNRDKNWRQRLKVSSNFFPAPFVHNVNERVFCELQLNFPVPNLTYEQQYELFKAADHEVKNIIGKVTLIQYLLQCVRQSNNLIYNHNNAYFIASWIERLIWHTEILKSTYKNRASLLVLEKNIRNLRNTLYSSEKENELNQQREDHQLIIHLYSLLPENQMNIDRDITPHNTRSSSRLKSPEMPVVYVDGKNADSKGGKINETVSTVIGMLTNNPHVHVRLINLTTARAKNIGERLPTNFHPKQDGKIIKRISGEVEPGASQKQCTPFDNCSMPHFSPSAPLLFPINTDGTGTIQEVTSRIIDALTNYRIEHLFLHDLPYQENAFLNILNNIWHVLNEQEKTPGNLTTDDLNRLSNYTVAAEGDSRWIQDAFYRHNIIATQIPSSFQTTPQTLSSKIIRTPISSKSTPVVEKTDINELSVFFKKLSIEQIQEHLPVLQQRVLEHRQNIKEDTPSKMSPPMKDTLEKSNMFQTLENVADTELAGSTSMPIARPLDDEFSTTEKDNESAKCLNDNNLLALSLASPASQKSCVDTNPTGLQSLCSCM
jgi:hypothetical protein